jgi:hypothetical protein
LREGAGVGLAMKRWAWLLGLIVAVSLVGIVHHWKKERAAEERQASYQHTVAFYSEVLKSGMSRKQVEDYLDKKGVSFSNICCVEKSGGTFDDITRIGREDAPWYCNEQNIYVAFEFVAVEPRDPKKLMYSLPSDELKKIILWPKLDGCL